MDHTVFFCVLLQLCCFACCSSRTSAISGPRKKGRWEEEEEDLTKDMEDPPSEPSIQEVQLAKQGELFTCQSIS